MGSPKLTKAQVRALGRVAEGGVDIRDIDEPFRQTIIDLGMMEPPLVDIVADWISPTSTGRAYLATLDRERDDG